MRAMATATAGVARKTQHSFAKRERERKKAEKAALKLARKAERTDPSDPSDPSIEAEEGDVSVGDAETPGSDIVRPEGTGAAPE